jgi:hypothetical protein
MRGIVVRQRDRSATEVLASADEYVKAFVGVKRAGGCPDPVFLSGIGFMNAAAALRAASLDKQK